MPSLCLIFRKTNPLFFSIERVFDQVAGHFGKEWEVETVRLPFYSSSLTHIFKNILFLRKRRASVYHITGDVHYAVLGLPRKRVLLTIHDCVFMRQPAGLKRSVLKWLFLDMPVRRSRMITTISEATRQDIIKYTGCSPDKIIVIPNPLNESVYHQPALFRADEPVILFLGSTPNKNLERVIPALEGLKCRLAIVGQIPDNHKTMLEQAGIVYSQSMNLTDKELADQYAAADLVLFPSVFEGFGLPVIEAQKAGRPVVTSDLSPMREVAGNGACLVDPYSVESIRKGVLAVIGDAAYRQELIEKGLGNVKRFSPEAVTRQYEECYKKLLSN